VRYHRGVRLALIVLALAASHAAAAPSIQFTKVPDGKYACTRYAPQSEQSSGLHVFAPPGKLMMFSFAAVASDRSKVAYRADGLPPGATVDAKGVFSWQIPATAKGKWTITLVAESPTAKATHAFTLSTAEPDLVAAWRAGMGSYEPDCAKLVRGYSFDDVDGDGKTELVFTIGDAADDSANTGSNVTYVRKRTARGFDTVERIIPSGGFETVTLPDGKPALAVQSSCCCMDHVWIVRVTATGVDELGNDTGDACSSKRLELVTNAKGQLHRIVTYGTDGTRHVKSWQDGRFER
jgi:hypothetical protein